jgi:DNA ligase-associated metallophosphoesterase
MSSPEARIRFGGHPLVLHAHGVIYWPAEKTLIASDLHFEKSTFLAHHGSIVPPYDTQDTLERLERLIAHYQPKRLILLGDSFHDKQAWARLDGPLRARIHTLVASVAECIWIEGNHDVALETHPLGALTAGITIAGLHFAHDDSAEHRPVIIGHYHPKAHVPLGARSASGKCFIHSETLLIMPSFGSYTGGLNIRHAAIQDLFAGQTARIHLLYRERVYCVPTE